MSATSRAMVLGLGFFRCLARCFNIYISRENAGMVARAVIGFDFLTFDPPPEAWPWRYRRISSAAWRRWRATQGVQLERRGSSSIFAAVERRYAASIVSPMPNNTLPMELRS